VIGASGCFDCGVSSFGRFSFAQHDSIRFFFRIKAGS
jgi:hypothetical protein